MPTFESVLLSGLPDGGFILLPRGTETLVHQTSVTAGVIEEMSLRVTNRNTTTIDVIVRLEKNAVLVHEHTVTIAGETTSTVMDAVPVGNDIDIKVTALLPPDGAVPYGSFLVASSAATYGVNPSTLTASLAISGLSHYTGYDSVNDILFKFDGSYIYTYRASTGSYLGQAAHSNGVIRGFDFDPVRKLFVFTATNGYSKYGYYTNETSPVVTGDITTYGTNCAVAISSKAIILFSTQYNYMYAFNLDNPTQAIATQSGIYGVTGIVADKNSKRIAFFGGASYPMYYMDCSPQFGTKVNTGKYHRYAAVFHPTNGTLYAIGSASSLFVTKITKAGTVTDHAIATGHSTNDKAYLCAYSKGSDIIAFCDSTNYGGLFNAATDTDITSQISVYNTNSVVDFPVEGLDPYCSGGADRQTP
tara:strand:+ start:600 stop:1850 length:1251 start_codon:yes stop_codon:yes gene_type:complete